MNLLKKTRREGVTLIELLTVISIMVVLMAIMIPQVRLITKDRSAREAARIVGSTMVDASNKARVDGFAGIAIARNFNVQRDDRNAVNQIFYAGYQMFQLRQPPSYVGNEIGDVAIVNINRARNLAAVPDPDPGEIEIVFPTPLDPNILANVTSGFVRLNGSKTMYRITSQAFGPNNGVLCEVPWHLEMPAANAAGVPFELVRDPVLRQTSQVDLPQGYMINLNYSGPIDFGGNDGDDWTWTALSQSVVPALQQEPVYIIFDDQGGIDRIYPNGFASAPIIPNASLHLCVAPDEVKHSYQPAFLSDALRTANPTDVLDDPSVMWISINHLNGSAVVTDTTLPATTFVPADSPSDVAEKKAARLLEALAITANRESSSQ